MKNYLNFNLNAKKFLLVWLLLLVAFVIPYCYFLFNYVICQPKIEFSLMMIPIFSVMFIGIIIAYFYYIKLFIVGLGYKEESIKFDGTLMTYIGKILLGTLLSIITLGIYYPWFIKDITRFFAENASYNSNNFNFLGRGRDLLLIVILTLLIPAIISGIIVGILFYGNNNLETRQIVIQIITLLIMIPFMYFFYKWFFDLNYKCYHITWKTKFWNSCGKIALEMLLSIITLGIYTPLAYLKLYQYFVGKTAAISNEKELKFGFEMDHQGEDFLFLWGQILLSIITLTIYTPWAISKIGKRFVGRTYTEFDEALED